jgi:hypothetical protein
MAMDLYYVRELVGNEGMPGAPPNGEIDIPNVTGQIRHLGLGQDSMIVSLSGKYLVSFPPPAIGSYLADFNSV